jgi:hypothetical protein
VPTLEFAEAETTMAIFDPAWGRVVDGGRSGGLLRRAVIGNDKDGLPLILGQ